MSASPSAKGDVTSAQNRWAILRSPFGKIGAAALAAVGAAIGLATWNYARNEVTPTRPLTVNVQTDPSMWNVPLANQGSITFVVPKKPGDIGTPPSKWSWDWHDWVYEMDGIESRTVVQLTLQGQTRNQVVVQGVSAKVLQRQEPLGGTAITSLSGGASPDVRTVGMNLDTGRPDYYYDPESGKMSKRPYIFTLNQGEAGVIYVDARTKKFDIAWKLKVALQINGETKVWTVPDDGTPFRTTADVGQPHYVWDDGWQPFTP